MERVKTQKAAHLIVGKRGEELAAEFLEARGFVITDRNWRAATGSSRHGEIDIVAQKGGQLYFVEVKTRSNIEVSSQFAPSAAMTETKRSRLASITEHYLEVHDFLGEVFHALLTVNIPSDAMPFFNYYPISL